jgi:hypothetical protein
MQHHGGKGGLEKVDERNQYEVIHGRALLQNLKRNKTLAIK